MKIEIEARPFGGWYITVHREECTFFYETNIEGRGLFSVYQGNRTQLTGTLQFTPLLEPRRAKAYIRRWFKEPKPLT